MLSINILRFMSNFSFKENTPYRLIPSGDRLIHPQDSLTGDTISRNTGLWLLSAFSAAGPAAVWSGLKVAP